MEFLKEKKRRIVEDKLAEATSEARMLGLELDELKEMLSILYKEEE